MDTLVINALRYKPHHSHMSVDEALEVVAHVRPRATWFTHIADGLGPHAQVDPTLPSGVGLAYDGLSVSAPL